MDYFEKWGYQDIKTEELDLLAQVGEGFNTFQDVILLKQYKLPRLELMKKQSEQLREQVQVKRNNLEEIMKLRETIDQLEEEEMREIQSLFEIEKKTQEELESMQIKKQKLPDLIDLNCYLTPINEKTRLQQLVKSKRDQLFGNNYNRLPPQTIKEALKENLDLKYQLQELQSKK